MINVNNLNDNFILYLCKDLLDYNNFYFKYKKVNGCKECIKNIGIPLLIEEGIDDKFKLWSQSRNISHCFYNSDLLPENIICNNKDKVETKGTIVYIEDIWLPFVNLLAVATKRKVIKLADDSSLNEKLISLTIDGPICMLISASLLTNNKMTFFSEFSSFYEFGVIPATDIYNMSWILAKILHAHFNKKEKSPFRCFIQNSSMRSTNKNGCLIYDGSEFSGSELTSTLETYHYYLGVMGHGGNIDVSLSSNLAVLCGKSIGNIIHEDKKTHYCQQGSYCSRVEIGQNLLIPIVKVQADILFLFTCMGIASMQGIYPYEITLAKSSLEGNVSSFISTISVASAPDWLPVLYASLINSGFSLGAALKKIAKILNVMTKSQPCLLILGDPTISKFPLINMEYNVKVDIIEDNIKIYLMDCESYYAEVDLLEAVGHELNNEEYVISFFVYDLANNKILNHEESYIDIVVSIQEIEGKKTCIICSAIGLKGKKIEINLKRQIYTNKYLEDYIRLLEKNEWFLKKVIELDNNIDNINSSKLWYKNSIDEFVKNSRKAINLFKMAREVPSRTNYFQVPIVQRNTIVQKVHKIVNEIISEEISTFSKWGIRFDFSEIYSSVCIDIESNRDKECEYCGSATDRTKLVAIERADIIRYRRFCHQCSVISDISFDMPKARIECPQTFERGRKLNIDIVFETLDLNFYDELSLFHIAIAIEGKIPWIDVKANPSVKSIYISKKSETVVSFELYIPSDTVLGIYYLTAIYSGNFGLSMISRPIGVVNNISSISNVNL
ncbi:hypothetical protein I7H67_00490 [Acinetobacter sp. ACIN00229]|uniref:hypothetical protein n=1 Tax=Acinetobacter sp. ACIN00229 TaxID=2792607 RepID=UPI0018DF5D95|nr:hypothetical protein [Acinetobacter sp. ACIN00229]MBI0421285.1 hypothetical protein [Acinetobacter sp. ACIN00229]